MVFEICERTDRHAHGNTSQPPGDEVTNISERLAAGCMVRLRQSFEAAAGGQRWRCVVTCCLRHSSPRPINRQSDGQRASGHSLQLDWTTGRPSPCMRASHQQALVRALCQDHVERARLESRRISSITADDDHDATHAAGDDDLRAMLGDLVVVIARFVAYDASVYMHTQTSDFTVERTRLILSVYQLRSVS